MSGHQMSGKDRRQYFVSHVTTSHKVRHLQGVNLLKIYLMITFFSIVAILFLFKKKKENEIHSKLATDSIDVFFFLLFSLTECRLCGLRAVGNNRKSGGRKRWIPANYVIDETL
jgi:hypothetical protein